MPDVVAVVVTGRGRSFSAGGDLEGYLRSIASRIEFSAFLDDFFQMLTAIEASSKIYIAAINGVCVAGGLELLLGLRPRRSPPTLAHGSATGI